jgi:hypothetical protein
MIQTRQQRSYPSVVTGLLVALAATVMAWMFMGCSFDAPVGVDVDTPEGINEVLNMAPVRPLEEAGRWTVYEVPGKLSVQHGYGCLGQGFAATKEYVGFRIQDSAAVRLAMADAGTILLNGWDLQYTNGDHHVAGLGTVIFNVTETRTEDQFVLNWEAGGVLSDKNGDDGYRWCYRYTLVFWNRGAFDAVVPLQTDVATTFIEAAYPSSGTALLDLPGHFPKPPYAGPQAVVPRGFGLSWSDTDHQVLQVGFDLGPATPVIAGNEITWTSQTLLKDDEPVDTYFGAEFVTVLSGQNVEMWQPRTVLHLTGTSWVEEPTELNLSPDDSSCDGFVAPEEYLEFYAVEKVPFDYAIPVLTGWDLSYVCPDHNVERIGAYLVEFDYVKDPTADTGTLRYTIFSTLRDDSDHGHAARYKVSILGLNGLGGGSKE